MVCLKVMQYFETVTEFLHRNLLHTDLTWNSTCNFKRIFGWKKSKVKGNEEERFYYEILLDKKMSISSTLYAHIFCTNFSPKQNVTRHITREKLLNWHSCEKFVKKTLTKLTAGRKLNQTKVILMWRELFSFCFSSVWKENVLFDSKVRL